MTRACLLVALLTAVPADGQGLAGVAADAEAARRGRAPAPAVSDADLEAKGPWALTVPRFLYYSAIRIELTTLRVAKVDLHGRLLDRSRSAGSLLELAPVLEAEPEVMAVLARHRVSASEYLRMDQAVLTATSYSVSSLPEPIRLHAVHWRNITFVFNHPALLREQSLQWGEQWHDTTRFIERY